MYCLAVNDFEHWRSQARQLLMRGVPPEQVAWQQQQGQLSFGEGLHAIQALEIKQQKPHVTKSFLAIAESVALHRDTQRWPLLYSIAWRLVYENKSLLHCEIDTQVQQVMAMDRAVRRDKHKMKAFVRFRQFTSGSAGSDPSTDEGTLPISAPHRGSYIAWFEPQHFIVASVAKHFFVNRFHTMSWSILTPDTCAHWNGTTLALTAGIPRPSLEDDALEKLWLTYYASIFNPSRLKLKAMQSEMPKKYWCNLPEAPLIKTLTLQASGIQQGMLEQRSDLPWSKTAKSRLIKKQHAHLHQRNT